MAAGVRLLTVLGGTCSRIVLLVSNVHLLSRPALRFMQVACAASPDLRLVLAGKHNFFHLLDDGHLTPLRRRLEAGSTFTLTSAHAAPMPTAADSVPPEQPVSFIGGRDTTFNKRRLTFRAGAGLGTAVAASLAFWLAWPAQPGHPPPATLAAALPQAPPPAALVNPGLPGGATPRAASNSAVGVPQEHVVSDPQPQAVAPSTATSGDTPLAAATEAIAPAVAASGQASIRPAELRPAPQGAAERRSAPAQTRVAANRSGTADTRPRREQLGPPRWAPHSDQPDYPYPPQPVPYAFWRQPAADPYQARPYIGTYAVDATGVRSFRFGP